MGSGRSRRWQALAPDGRTVVHRAATRTEAVDQLLATPGPLFGDPADTVLHDLWLFGVRIMWLR